MQRLPKEMKHAVPEDTTEAADETSGEGDVQGHAFKTIAPDPPFTPRRPSGGELTDDDPEPDQARSV
jgi:hypothetical protein